MKEYKNMKTGLLDIQAGLFIWKLYKKVTINDYVYIIYATVK